MVITLLIKSIATTGSVCTLTSFCCCLFKVKLYWIRQHSCSQTWNNDYRPINCNCRSCIIGDNYQSDKC